MAITEIHSDQLGESAMASLLAPPPTRHSSRMAARRESTEVRSTPSRTVATAWRVRSISGRLSSWATATSTSAWKSAWFSHTRRMTEALVTWTPVVRSTRSNTRLKVRLLEPVSIPSSRRIWRPASNTKARSSLRLSRVRRGSAASAASAPVSARVSFRLDAMRPSCAAPRRESNSGRVVHRCPPGTRQNAHRHAMLQGAGVTARRGRRGTRCVRSDTAPGRRSRIGTARWRRRRR